MTTLFDVGAAAKKVAVRCATRDDAGELICPECGSAIGDTRGTIKLPVDAVAAAEVRERLEGIRFPSHGVECERHAVRVACPKHLSNPRGTGMSGWAGLPLVFADGAKRYVPVPERELEAIGVEWPPTDDEQRGASA